MIFGLSMVSFCISVHMTKSVQTLSYRKWKRLPALFFHFHGNSLCFPVRSDVIDISLPCIPCSQFAAPVRHGARLSHLDSLRCDNWIPCWKVPLNKLKCNNNIANTFLPSVKHRTMQYCSSWAVLSCSDVHYAIAVYYAIQAGSNALYKMSADTILTCDNSNESSQQHFSVVLFTYLGLFAP